MRNSYKRHAIVLAPGAELYPHRHHLVEVLQSLLKPIGVEVFSQDYMGRKQQDFGIAVDNTLAATLLSETQALPPEPLLSSGRLLSDRK
jgi:hypothetical protein